MIFCLNSNRKQVECGQFFSKKRQKFRDLEKKMKKLRVNNEKNEKKNKDLIK